MPAEGPAALPTERERRDLDRLLTFVDAIVAIAITLLVLPLVELTADLGEGTDVLDVLQEHQAQFWAFLLSFAVIARLWFAQHGALSHTVRTSAPVSALLMVWAFTIVVLPFPTSLVATASDDPWTKVAYIGTMIVSLLAIGLLVTALRRRPDLTDDDADPDAGPVWVNLAILVVALAISLLIPAIGYLPLLLLAVDDPILRVVRRVVGLVSPRSGS